MSNGPRIIYVPLPDTTPEKELDALAVVYKFVLDRHPKKNAAEASCDDKGSEEHRTLSKCDEDRR